MISNIFYSGYLLITIMVFIIFTGCKNNSDMILAPYGDFRPLSITTVTHGFNPDIDWLGGRVAAVGINRGMNPGLDSTLVWLRTASADTIGAYATMGIETDYSGISSFNGTAVDSLEHGTTYTFWIATLQSFEHNLDSAYSDEHNFASRVMKLNLKLNGRVGGQKGLINDISIIRDQNITSERIHVSWEPKDEGFNQVVLRYGTDGGYTNRLYHIVTADTTNSILPPITLGDEEENIRVIQEWEPFSLIKGKLYFFWMSKTSWREENFSSKAFGYAYYLMYKIPN